MEYSHDDAGLLRQPIGYWSHATSTAVLAPIRATLAAHGLTQPQNWVIGQLREGPRSREDLVATLSGYLEVGAPGIEEAFPPLLERGLIAEESGLLALTAEGEEFLGDYLPDLQATLARIHRGISDEEYLTTLKVLQRMIRNAGGSAWHH